MNDPYRDDNGVLRNKLGLTDAVKLSAAEYELSTQRQAQLQDNPIKGDYDLEHLKKIHKHLFNDVYQWAGQEREINFSKRSEAQPGWKSVFVDKDALERVGKEAHALTKELMSAAPLDKAAFVERIVPVYAKWNALHPFPEGNGRALQTMLGQLAREMGQELEYGRVNGADWREAAANTMERTNVREPVLKIPPNLAPMRAVFEKITQTRAQDKSFSNSREAGTAKTSQTHSPASGRAQEAIGTDKVTGRGEQDRGR